MNPDLPEWHYKKHTVIEQLKRLHEVSIKYKETEKKLIAAKIELLRIQKLEKKNEPTNQRDSSDTSSHKK